MKILLASTGRGAELCVFSSFVYHYKQSFSSSTIVVATSPPYKTLAERFSGIDEWVPLNDNATMRDGFHLHEYANNNSFDIYEDLSERIGIGDPPKLFGASILQGIYAAIQKPFFTEESVPRRVSFSPTSEEAAEANEILGKHKNIILVSHDCTSAKNPLSLESYNELAYRLQEFGTVCYTGITGTPDTMKTTPEIKGAVDLRDISYGTLYALSKGVVAYIGLDTATTWVCSDTKAPIVTLRQDPIFELWHSGMVTMGYREKENTFELERELDGCSEQEIIGMVQRIIGNNL